MTTNLTGVGYSLQGITFLVQYDTIIYPYLKTYRNQINQAMINILANGGNICFVSHQTNFYYAQEMANVIGSITQYNKRVITGMPYSTDQLKLGQFFNQWFYQSGTVKSYKSVIYLDSDQVMCMYASAVGMQTCSVNIFIPSLLTSCIDNVAKNNINYGAHGALASHTDKAGLIPIL